QAGGQLVAAEGTATGADATVFTAREPNPGSGAVAEPGVASAQRAGVDSEEEVARGRRDAERVVRGPARQTGQECRCRVAAARVQRDQPGSGGGRQPASTHHSLDSSATEAVASVGIAARPVSPPHSSFPRTTPNLSRTGGLKMLDFDYVLQPGIGHVGDGKGKLFKLLEGYQVLQPRVGYLGAVKVQLLERLEGREVPQTSVCHLV